MKLSQTTISRSLNTSFVFFPLSLSHNCQIVYKHKFKSIHAICVEHISFFLCFRSLMFFFPLTFLSFICCHLNMVNKNVNTDKTECFLCICSLSLFLERCRNIFRFFFPANFNSQLGSSKWLSFCRHTNQICQSYIRHCSSPPFNSDGFQLIFSSFLFAFGIKYVIIYVILY